MEPPTALEPRAISREKNRSSARCSRSSRPRSCAGSTPATSTNRACARTLQTETFIALKCFIDNWRWAGVPFYLRTGKRMAEGARIISIAFKEPPQSMFPPGSGVGDHGPDHLTSTSPTSRGFRSPSTASTPARA